MKALEAYEEVVEAKKRELEGRRERARWRVQAGEDERMSALRERWVVLGRELERVKEGVRRLEGDG